MKKKYSEPSAENVLLSFEQIICDSPNPGENEGISYEDWTL